MRERIPGILLLTLVAMLPFEFRRTWFGLSNLQWLFVLVGLAALPAICRNARELVRQRTVQCGAIFVAVQWLAALLAPDFQADAGKAAVRFSAGFALLIVVASIGTKERTLRVWAVAAIVGASYSVLSQLGLGWPSLFRTEEFYVDGLKRLSGSFEYPNTAAAYFAMSLPLVVSIPAAAMMLYGATAVLCIAIMLTWSRGAMVAACLTGLEFRKFFWIAVPCAVLCFLVAYLNSPVAGRYASAYNVLRQSPGTNDSVRVSVWNDGRRTWSVSGPNEIGLSYRWFDVEDMQLLPEEPVRTHLQANVPAGGMTEAEVRFRTPARPGKYLLSIELFRGNLDWFSRSGVIPLLVEVEVEAGASRHTGRDDLTRWYRKGQGDYPALTASVARTELWKAAIRMIREHPFLGTGPDSYRLMYGKYLGYSEWNREIHSNNLYLELATGSGLTGLLSFLMLVFSRKWDLKPVSLALLIFLIHGMVDVFLMTTPVYFGFWILMGLNENRI